ncbi:MAG: hypothetical protein NWE78_05615 [Candidatus Bathyarchaeota archaeon]|nr:hypothetical protein [Candidatus Bathyarchaeota archaeon]
MLRGRVEAMYESRLQFKLSRGVLAVVTLLILVSSTGIAEASAYYSLTLESQTTVNSPDVILQNGSAGTSTIYTNNTSAKVSVQENNTLELWVDGFTDEEVDWQEVGASPYLDAIDYASNYVWITTLTDTEYESRFNFTDSNNLGTITDVKICLYAMCEAGGNDEVEIYLYNSTGGPYSISQFLPTAGSWGWHNYSCLSTLPTWMEVNNGQLRLRAEKIVSGETMYVDAALLFINYTRDNFDYILRVNNTETDSWEIRLKKYSDSGGGRLQNCTIYFRNSTNANSTQVVIENGAFNQAEGPWFNLGSLETIYLAMTVETNSTGTSYVYTYLEIRKPGTTTYLQYTIAFEIT